MVGKIFRRSLIVYILSDVAHSAGPLVDGIVTGNFLGVDAVAAISLVAPSIFIFNFAVCILASGSQSVCTGLFGQGKIDEANSVFTLTNILAAVCSLMITFIILAFSHPIMRLLGADETNQALENYGAEYLSGYALGLVFLYWGKILHGFMNIDNDSSRTVYAMTAMTITNIIGDFYVILFTNAGVFGLAVATSLSSAVYFAVLALHFLRKDRILRLNFRAVINLPSTLAGICKHGSVSAVSRLTKALAGITINHIIVFYATSYELAAYGAQNQMLSLAGSLYLGIADTIWMLASVYYGEEDKSLLDELQITSMITGISLAAICSVFMFMFSDFFAGLYLGRENLQVLAMGSEAVKYLAFALPLYVFIFGFVNYLQGVKGFVEANIFTVIMQLVIPVSVIYVTVKYLGYGAWCAAPASVLITSIICCIYISLRRTPATLKKRLLLKKQFITDEGNELSLAADSEMEVMGMSQIAQLFCMENNFSRKIAMHLSLCIEELGMNIIKHGFNDGRKHYIYMRMIAKDNNVVLRIRDDCKPFNPLEYYQMTNVNEDDPAKNIGIRVVMSMCSDVIYLSMFQTNNLIIKMSDEQKNSQVKYTIVDNLAEKMM